MAANTVKAWLSVLQATYQVLVLRPYHANVSKLLVKTPKVHFTDVGTPCYLTKLRGAEHTASGPLGGAIFETAVVTEIVRTLTHRGEEPRLYFWRTAAGAEVDVLVERGGRLPPVEVKLSATPRPAMAAGIQRRRHANTGPIWLRPALMPRLGAAPDDRRFPRPGGPPCPALSRTTCHRSTSAACSSRG